MDNTRKDCSEAWLDAIQAAMMCVNTALVPGNQDGSYAGGSDRATQASLDYLTLLETILEQQYENWDQVPTVLPPEFKQGRNGYGGGSQTHYDSHVRFENDDEAGDVVVVRNPDQSHKSPRLVMRRLAIRIMTAQSELYAQRASHCRNERPHPQWKLGAETYQTSLDRIMEAIQLADSEISRLFSLGQEATDLADDANVVHIAISFFATERDAYLRAARAQEQRLLKKLQPQWSSRDDARGRIGDERWRNNPHPRNDYRKKRIVDEQQLKDVRAAVKALMEMNDVTSLSQDAKHLQNRLLQQPQEDLQRRYNGLRPTDLSKRVSLRDYPDPTNFGWTFTGSWQHAEFFEKDEVKLDWYYTTATIKTSMDHPTQGRTQLFGKRVDPAVYRKILLNPREHTNRRYHNRRGKTAHHRKRG